MTPKEALKRFMDFINYSKPSEVNTFVFYGYEIAELQKFLKEHKRLQAFKKTFDAYELAKKQDFIAYENWQECEKELEELKRDVKRYFELDFNLTRDGVFHYSFLQTSKLENETIQECETRLDNEFDELKEKLSKAGKE